ncbi:glycosyl hydrolase family 28-related protein [Burkholderia singularis]|uniref:Phage tail fibers n=1 Tax=Burkholderia singularis TaxID=1503053 RepID=A0A238H7L3_9BURK|nr:glycosyl hydrolase family 28-related protein [Burkholderia singularis]SMG01075.1 Phage tail fibers [Burkholderia singularis]
MTVTSDFQEISYQTDGTTFHFPIPFYFLSDDHIVAYAVAPDGAEHDLVHGTDFILSGAGNESGGSLTLLTPLAAGNLFTISRVVPITQESKYQQNDPFPSSTTEKALDKLTMIDQQHASAIGLALLFPRNDKSLSLNQNLPAKSVRSNAALGFNNDGNPISISLKIGSVETPVVDNRTMLRAVDPSTKHVFVAGADAPADGGGGLYIPRQSSAPASWDNDGTQITTAHGIGYELQYTDAVSASVFGARADGVANDHAAYQKAIDYMFARGGGVVYIPTGGRSLIDNDLDILPNVTLRGHAEGFGSPGNNYSTPYGNVCGALILNPAATIRVHSNASLTRALIYRKGMTFPVTSISDWQGTAVTINGDDTTVERLLVMGFDKLLKLNGFARPRIMYVYGDCNNGFDIAECRDIPHFNKCHMWPFATIAAVAAGANPALLVRPGTAYALHDGVDGAMFANNFSFGYMRGLLLLNTDSTTVMNFWSDGPYDLINGAYKGAIGMQVEGKCQYGTRLIGCQASSQMWGVHVNTNPGLVTMITDCSFWYNLEAGVDLAQGDAIVTTNNFYDANYGVVTRSTSPAIISNNRFQAQRVRPIESTVKTATILLETNHFVDLPAGQPPVGASLILTGRSLDGSALNLPPTIPQDTLAILGGGRFNTVNGGFAGQKVCFSMLADTTIAHTPYGGDQAPMNTIVNKAGRDATVLAGLMAEYRFNGRQWIEL